MGEPQYPERTRAVIDGRCPDCGHDLDTGWECIACPFDGYAIAQTVLDVDMRA
jgi:C4-type Zn-finger protein